MLVHRKSVRRAALVAGALLFLVAPRLSTAQAPRADSLSIRDLLDVSTAQIADLSPDGHWLAVTV